MYTCYVAFIKYVAYCKLTHHYNSTVAVTKELHKGSTCVISLLLLFTIAF